MSETNKRKRKEENLFDQSTVEHMSENKITLGAEFSDTADQPQTQPYNIQQPIFLNQLPIVQNIQNQQLVYQVEGVQGLNNLNFATATTANGNGQQQLLYIVIPSTNENVQIEALPVEVVKKEEKDGVVGDGQQQIEFIKVDDVGRAVVDGVDEVLADGDKEKYFLNETTMQLTQTYETSQQQQPTQLHTIVQKPEGVYIVEEPQVSYAPVPSSTIESPPPPPPPTPTPPVTTTTNHTSNNNNSSKNILRTHGYKCDYPPCTMAFSSIYEKKAHMDVHLFPESTEFKCNICNEVFIKAADRNKHVETHAVVNTFKCKNCRAAFPYYTSLVKHIDENRCVQKNKLHVCYFCGSKFVNHVDLEMHHEANLKVCSCKAKICGEQSFEVHTNLCSAYKNKMNKCRKKLKTTDSVVVLD